MRSMSASRWRRSRRCAGFRRVDRGCAARPPATADGRKREFQRKCLRTVIEAARKAGDKRVAFAPLHQYAGTPTNAHPVAYRHEQMADELIGSLRSLVGW